MKKLLSPLAIFLLVSMIFVSSCAKEENDPTTQGGTFVGNWAINENSSDFGPNAYSLTISDTASNIQFAHLYGLNSAKTFALVSGNNFTIPHQTIDGADISGGGILTSPTRIDMTYYVHYTSANYDTVVAILNKI